MKLNISTGTVSTLNINCDNTWKHATLSSNGHIYVTPEYFSDAKCIMDFDPSNDSFSKILHSSVNEGNEYSGLVENKNRLYGISKQGVIEINVITNKLTFIEHELGDGDWVVWSNSIVGSDGRVYALSTHNKLVRYDPIQGTTTITTKTGYDGNYGWSGMSPSSDGHGYCAPNNASQILKIFISRGHWLYLKHRLLIHESRATTQKQDHEGLETVRQFIIGANDDEFSHVMEFV